MKTSARKRLLTLLASVTLLSTLAGTFAAGVSADAGNPILGSITSSHTFNPDGTVTVFVRGEWNWLSHGSDCNFNRAATGVGIIWNDPTETGYTVANGGISAGVGIASKNGSWADPNPLDPMVHPVDLGNVPEGYTAAGTDYPAGQQFVDPASNNPADFDSWKGGCGREPLSATASKTGGASCGDGTQNCADRPWGSWGYTKNGGQGYSHTFRSLADITKVCANFYDVHGGGNIGKSFQDVNGAKEITVNQNGDNSIDTNAFNVNEGANCITIPIPKLQVKKVVDKATANPGDTLTYTITVKNLVSLDITGVNITDDISPVVPGHGSLTGSNPTATVSGGNQLSWSNQTIPGLSTVTYKYFVKLADTGWPNGQTTLPNTVVVTKSNCEAGSNDPDCKTVTIVTPQPDLSIVKTADAVSVVAGNPIGFVITATNSGTSTLTNVNLSDPLPVIAGLGIAWSVASSSPANTCQVAAANLTCSFGSLAAGASASVHVTSPTTAPAAGAPAIADCLIQVKNHSANLDNTATVTSANLTKTDRDGICLQVPGLSIVKTADAVSVVAGNPIGFVITATNSGTSTLTNVNLSDPLPVIAGLGIAWSVASSSPANTCQVAAANLTCSFGSLAAGASASVHVTSPTTAPAAGAPAIADCLIQVKNHSANLDNTATVTSANLTKTDRDGICLQVPGLSIVKTADAVSVVAGNPIGFVITATNSGTSTLTNVNLSDPLPVIAGLGIAWSVASSSPANTCQVAAANLTCSFGSLAAGASASVHVTSPTTAPAAGAPAIADCLIQVKNHSANLDNTATVTSANLTKTDRDGICLQVPGLSIVKTADAVSVVAGNPIGFVITATNSGTSTLTNVNLSDPLPVIAGLGIAWSVASSSPANTCQVAAANLTCSFGSLAAGASASVHVTSPTTAPAAGAPAIADCLIQVKNHSANLDNTATVTSANLTKTDRDGICIVNKPHLTVTKTPDAQGVIAGNPVGFTITVKSDGVGTATGVVVSDALPTLAGAGINWSISPAYAGPGTCAITGAAPSQTLSCQLGDLASGTSASVHVTSQTTAPTGNTTLTPCTISVVTYVTNLDNSVQVTSSNALGATAQTGTCVSITPNAKIAVTKVANPTLLPIGGGPVLYSYSVTNPGNVRLVNVSLVDDKCAEVVFLGGDTNGDAALDLSETWKYSCNATITVTTINTATASGFWSDPTCTNTCLEFHNGLGLRKVSAQAQAIVTVPKATPTPSGSVQGATSPPKPLVTLPPTDSSTPLGTTGGSNGFLMILVLLAGLGAAVPVLAFGKRRTARR